MPWPNVLSVSQYNSALLLQECKVFGGFFSWSTAAAAVAFTVTVLAATVSWCLREGSLHVGGFYLGIGSRVQLLVRVPLPFPQFKAGLERIKETALERADFTHQLFVFVTTERVRWIFITFFNSIFCPLLSSRFQARIGWARPDHEISDHTTWMSVILKVIAS